MVLDHANEATAERIHENFPGSYQHSETLFLIADEGVTASVAKVIGLDGSNPAITGAIFKLNSSYAGFTQRSLWEWLATAEEKS